MRKVTVIKPFVIESTVEPEDEITKPIPIELVNQLRYGSCPPEISVDEKVKRASSPRIVEEVIERPTYREKDILDFDTEGSTTCRIELADLTIKRATKNYVRLVKRNA